MVISGCRALFLALAASCISSATSLAASPFDFLFGKSQEPPPPAATVGPKGTAAKKNEARHEQKKRKKAAVAKPSTPLGGANTAPIEVPLAPYDRELMRLSEILGALTYLENLCLPNATEDWRAKMQSLLDAEAEAAPVKGHLAGSYNRGFHDYERAYHFCTPNAQIVIGRFLAESHKIAHDVINRYGSS
ncbi:MAG TPA: TIGR02301 family protein [Methylocella sp.]|nr:TIGR02301 family protein [Methylocella sp.]